MNTKLDLSFSHQYEVEVIENLHSEIIEERQFYFPNNLEKGSQDCLLIKVIPDEGMPWVGIFGSGYDSPHAVTGIYSHPDGRSVCVISAGQGHIVRTDDPTIWEEIKAFPILDVRLIPIRQLLVFADFTEMTAYGLSGMEWKTSRLSWDGLKITEATPDFIQGLAWDAPQQQEVEFFVDVKTGHHKGGSNPEQYPKD